MSSGHQEEEYEDELYREDEGSWSSGTESEVEGWLYSQLHYSSGLGRSEEEDDGEDGQRWRETGDEEGARSAVGRDGVAGRSSPMARQSPAQRGSLGKDSDLDSDSDGVESWMILDGGEYEGDCNILLNVEVQGSSSSSAEDENNPHSWTVSEKDMQVQTSSGPDLQRTYRYYCPSRSVTCQSCRRAGHFSRDCPLPKKRPCCVLCGSEGHRQHACPHRYCPNCCLPGHGLQDCQELAYWHKRCHRCGATGHLQDACPDVWRQYHLTESGSDRVARGRRFGGRPPVAPPVSGLIDRRPG